MFAVSIVFNMLLDIYSPSAISCRKGEVRRGNMVSVLCIFASIFSRILILIEFINTRISFVLTNERKSIDFILLGQRFHRIDAIIYWLLFWIFYLLFIILSYFRVCKCENYPFPSYHSIWVLCLHFDLKISLICTLKKSDQLHSFTRWQKISVHNTFQ